MQVFIPIFKVDINNIFFTEKRKNVILDGEFVKILYSTECFEMNGLHTILSIYRSVSDALSFESDLYSTMQFDCNNVAIKRNFSHIQTNLSKNGSAISEVREQLIATQKSMLCNSPKLKIDTPLELKRAVVSSKPQLKWVATFNPFLDKNTHQIERLCAIERGIIDQYIKLYALNKNPVYNLKTQLISGAFRYSKGESGNGYAEYMMYKTNTFDFSFAQPETASNESSFFTNNNLLDANYALKISGIWETKCNVGITVKFIQFTNSE